MLGGNKKKQRWYNLLTTNENCKWKNSDIKVKKCQKFKYVVATNAKWIKCKSRTDFEIN